MSVVPYHKLEVIRYSPVYREQCLDLARKIHGESAYGNMPFLAEKVLKQMEGPLLKDPYYLRLAVRGPRLYGAFMGQLVRAMFCDLLMAKDLGWMVLPEHRGSGAAILLLRDFERWGASKGAVKLMVGQGTAVDIERTMKLYKHCGYTLTGYNTIKEVESCQPKAQQS